MAIVKASSSAQNFPHADGSSAGPWAAQPGAGGRRISSAVTASRRADAHDSIRCQARSMPISSSSEAPRPRPSSPVASSQNEASATPGKARSSGALDANPAAGPAGGTGGGPGGVFPGREPASADSADATDAAKISASGTPMYSGGHELSCGSWEYQPSAPPQPSS